MLTLRQRGTKKVWNVRGIVSIGAERVVVKEQSTGSDKRAAAVEVQAKIERDIRRRVRRLPFPVGGADVASGPLERRLSPLSR